MYRFEDLENQETMEPKKSCFCNFLGVVFSNLKSFFIAAFRIIFCRVVRGKATLATKENMRYTSAIISIIGAHHQFGKHSFEPDFAADIIDTLKTRLEQRGSEMDKSSLALDGPEVEVRGGINVCLPSNWPCRFEKRSEVPSGMFPNEGYVQLTSYKTLANDFNDPIQHKHTSS